MIEKLKQYHDEAISLDSLDPLQKFKECFTLPKDPGALYFCSNSLGLPAKAASQKLEEQLQRWSELGARGWFEGEGNWYNSLEEPIVRPLSKILGAESNEVTLMNSLTVNLHMLLISFYRPTKTRYKILIDGPAFPSDLYAIKSHLRFHKKEEGLILIEPRPGEHLVREEDFLRVIKKQGEEIALVFLNCVNFLSGQVLKVDEITRYAKEAGCCVGYDLAHAAGNIPLSLHDLGGDFAVGCSYKYLCGGPGGPGIAYVHASHHHQQFVRFSGWWGNDPNTRFDFPKEFVPYGGASSWQVSTPSILAKLPLIAALEVFEEAGMENIREKSKKQTTFLYTLLENARGTHFDMITPKEPELRGCQLSLRIKCSRSEEILRKLERLGITCDFRPPNILRVAPSPLYTSFYEIYRFAYTFLEVLKTI